MSLIAGPVQKYYPPNSPEQALFNRVSHLPLSPQLISQIYRGIGELSELDRQRLITLSEALDLGIYQLQKLLKIAPPRA